MRDARHGDPLRTIVRDHVHVRDTCMLFRKQRAFHEFHECAREHPGTAAAPTVPPIPVVLGAVPASVSTVLYIPTYDPRAPGA